MFATTNKTAPAHNTLKMMIALVAAVLAFVAFTAAPAGAIEGPNDWAPGGNGPDEDEPWVLNPGLVAILGPTALVEVSCTDEIATVTIENKTPDFYPITVEADGSVADFVNLGGNQMFQVEVPLAENDSAFIEVYSGDNTIFTQDVERDCLLPDPSYEIFSDCGIEQAYVRLSNSGDDVANMAVQYHPNPFATQQILPGDSLDWPLVVTPNTSIDFTVRHGLDALGVESFFFDCPIPEPTPPVATPTPTPEPPAPTPEPEPTPTPQETTEEVTGEDAEQVAGPEDEIDQDELVVGEDGDDDDQDLSREVATASSGVGGFFKALVGLMLAAAAGIFILLFARRRDEELDPMASV